jgi:catechol 2,3-dioxygenase-like lactoylglutathione lyase family enzyme
MGGLSHGSHWTDTLLAVDHPRLVPELYCSDIEETLRFYTAVLGFKVLYARPEDRFAYLDRDGAEIMVEQSVSRAWIPAPLEQPYGRGVNFQIEVTDVDALYEGVQGSGATIFLTMEEKWYRRDDVAVGNRQFIVQDPDGYLLRFAQDLGERPA